MNPIMQTLDASKRLLGFRLAELAHRSGFSIPNIDDAEGKEERFLHDMLHTLPVELYRFGADIPQLLLVSFKDYLRASMVENEAAVPSTTLGPGESPPQRCGRSCGGSSEDDDRLHLLVEKLHAPLAAFHSVGDDISSFYIKRSIYLAFFGHTRIPGSAVNGSPQESIFSE